MQVQDAVACLREELRRFVHDIEFIAERDS
jgi:hypothetical protein